MSRLRRELGNLGPPDKKFKLDILSKNTSNDDIIGPNRLINIEDMNTVLNAKSLCSKCRCNTLQLRDVFFIGAAHYVSISCTKCSSNANTTDLKQDDFNYSTSHYYNSNEIDDSVIVPRRTNSAGNSDIYRKICSYETNIQLMLLTIYLGKSGRATASIAGALGFPKPSAMVKSFHRHADTVGKTIRSAVESIEEENLQLEILATLNGRNDGITYDHTIFLSNGKLRSDVPPVGLHTSYDMGWQKRSSGRRYDSPSGHGLLVGQKSKVSCATKCSQSGAGHVTWKGKMVNEYQIIFVQRTTAGRAASLWKRMLHSTCSSIYMRRMTIKCTLKNSSVMMTVQQEICFVIPWNIKTERCPLIWHHPHFYVMLVTESSAWLNHSSL